MQSCHLPSAGGGKVRLLCSSDTELWKARPGWSLNIAGHRKGCESGWGRLWNRSQMSNQLNTTTSCWSISKTFPLYSATFCSRAFKHSFRIKSMNANSQNKNKLLVDLYMGRGEHKSVQQLIFLNKFESHRSDITSTTWQPINHHQPHGTNHKTCVRKTPTRNKISECFTL